MDLDAALITFVASPLDPAARHETLQDVTDSRPLHSQARGKLRGGQARAFCNTGERPMDGDWRIGRAFELLIQPAHAIDEIPGCEQGLSLQLASARGAGPAVEDSSATR